MKLLTYDPGTGPRCGVLDGDAVVDVAALLGSPQPLRDVRALLELADSPVDPGRRRLGRQRSCAEGGAGRRSPAFSRAPTAHDPGLHRLRRTRHVPRDPGR